MCLPSSFPLSMSQIASELGQSLPKSLRDADVRNLAGTGSGSISFSHLLGKCAVDFQHRGNFSASTGSTNVASVTGVSFGSAVSGRRIIVAVTVHRQGVALNTSQPSVSIGGVSASVVAYTFRQRGVNQVVLTLIAHAVVNSGSSGTVSLTFAGNHASHAVRLSSFRLISPNTSPSHSNSVNGGETDGTSISTTINIPSNGILISAAASMDASITSQSNMGSSASFEQNLTLFSFTSAGRRVRFQSGMSAQSGRNVSITVNIANSGKCISVMSWNLGG